MPIDPRIALGVQPVQIQMPDPNAGMNALARAMQIKSFQQEQQANALKIDRQNKLMELTGATYAKPEDREEALLRGGFIKESADLTKNRVDAAKVQADTDKNKVDAAHKRVDAWGQIMGYVRQNPTAENATAAVQHLVSMGVLPAEMGQQALAGLQANPNPQAIAQFADMGFRAALSVKDQLAKFQTNNIGGQTITQGIDPVTGKATLVSAVQNTQSPDNAASVAATIRGQNLTDARARENAALTRQGLDLQRDAARTQVVETPEGVMLVDKATGQARPATANGKPLAGKPSAATEKELVGIRQQNSIVDGAIAAVQKTPSAFSMTRGMATMAGPIPESVAGRFDNDAERQARSYVFNNVSKVINERAGAAQSAQELARLRSFLPAETDNADQIVSKLQAFKTYLGDMEAGTRGGKSNSGATGGWSIQKVN